MKNDTEEPSNELQYIPREIWGAVEPQVDRLKHLNLPVEHIVTTWTETDTCFTREECMERVRTIQAEQLEQGLPDIEYNFLMGSDGYIYEGRGFNFEGPEYPASSKSAKDLIGKCIEVAFIDKSCNDATDNISRALGNLISIGIEIEALKGKINFFSRTGTYFSFVHTYNIKDEEKFPEKKAPIKDIKRRTPKPPRDKFTS